MPSPKVDPNVWKERPQRGETNQQFLDRLSRDYKIPYPTAARVVRHNLTFAAIENARTVADLKPVLTYILENLHAQTD